MKNILIVTPLLPPEPGGPSYYAGHLREALEEKGFDVDMVAFRDVRHLPSVVRHIVFFFKVLRRGFRREAFIILDTVSVAVPAVLAGKVLRKETIVRVGGDFVWERYIERTGKKVLLSDFYERTVDLSFKERFIVWMQKHAVLALADSVVFNTEWQRALWRTPYALGDAKTGVVQNATKNNERTHVGGGGFLCAWRGTAFKNVDTLQKAYEVAQRKCPGVRLDIFKNIPREELYDRMEHARALIIPSLTELSPNMAFEALSMGLPVLVTKDCGAKDVLEGLVTWIDPTNPEDIAGKMCMLMGEDAYEKEKKKIKNTFVTRTYKDIAEDFLQLLQEQSPV